MFIKDELKLEENKTEIPRMTWTCLTQLRQYQERIQPLSANISKMQTWELEIVLCEPKNNSRTNLYEMAANTLKLDTNKIFHVPWSLDSSNCSSEL